MHEITSMGVRNQLGLALLLCTVLFEFVGCSIASHSARERSPKILALSETPLQQSEGGQEIVHFIPQSAEAPQPTTDGTLIDMQHAWVKGERGIFRTIDGGKNWQTFVLSPADELVFGRLSELSSAGEFVTAARGWLVARSGTWQTEDGGETWHRIFVDAAVGPVFVNQQSGWMSVATKVGQQSFVTQDGGKTWHPCGPIVTYEKQTPARRPYFLTPQLGWTVTSQTQEGSMSFGVARTDDGGCHWRQTWTSGQDTSRDQDERYGDIQFVSNQEGWLGGDYLGSLHHTTDAGRKWKRVQLPREGLKVVNVYFEDSTKGWIIGGYPSMLTEDTGEYFTGDGGKTWRQLKQGEIVDGFDDNGGHFEVPEKWNAGKLFQLLHASRVENSKN